jgi:acetolactate synthase I/II/III large subunit
LLAGHVLVKRLAELGAGTVYGVPGESFLPLLDALVDQPGMPFVSCRAEGGASFMACADARLMARPAVLAVTRGHTHGIAGCTAHAFVGGPL